MGRLQTVIVLCCVSLALLLPIKAHADAERIRNVKVSIDEGAVRIKLGTHKTLGKYKVHARRRQMRIWFARTRVARHFVRQGDGHWIKSVHVRPGVSNTAVVQIRFGRKMPFDAKALEVSPKNGETLIMLARDKASLPPQKIEKTPDNKQTRRTTKAPQSAPAKSSQKNPELILPKADGKGFEAPAAEEAPGEGKLIRAKAEAPKEQKETKKGFDFLSNKEKKSNEESASFGTEKETGMGSVSNILLLILLLGGGVYMGIKRFFPSAKKSGSSDIEVVATRHIGPRTQLMVVRALGNDHLLSIHAGKTERFAFAPSSSSPSQEATLHSAPQHVTQASASPKKPARISSYPANRETDPKEVLKSMRKGWRLFSGMQTRDPYSEMGNREETHAYPMPNPSMHPVFSQQPVPSQNAIAPPDLPLSQQPISQYSSPGKHPSSSGMLPLAQEHGNAGNTNPFKEEVEQGDWLQQKPNKHHTVRFDFLRGSEEAPDLDDEETRKVMQESDFGQQVIRSATTPYLGRESDGSVFATPESVHGLLRLQERVKDSSPVSESAYPSRYPSAAER